MNKIVFGFIKIRKICKISIRRKLKFQLQSNKIIFYKTANWLFPNNFWLVIINTTNFPFFNFSFSLSHYQIKIIILFCNSNKGITTLQGTKSCKITVFDRRKINQNFCRTMMSKRPLGQCIFCKQRIFFNRIRLNNIFIFCWKIAKIKIWDMIPLPTKINFSI